MTLVLVLTPGRGRAPGRRTTSEVPRTELDGAGTAVFAAGEVPGRGVDAVVGSLELVVPLVDVELARMLSEFPLLLAVLTFEPPLELVAVDPKPPRVPDLGGLGTLLLLALDCAELGDEFVED